MPVTFAVSSVTPGTFPRRNLQTPEELFDNSYIPKRDKYRILHCSLTEAAHYTACSNGFVHSVLQAYGAHYHLVIRPDDVWIAILTQLNFYVNAHAEELSEYFVAHGGTRRRTVTINAREDHAIDFGRLAYAMTGELQKTVVDSTLAEWILPDFTTTTIKDTTICSIIMMTMSKTYFQPVIIFTCGIPTITLEGNKADWQRILKRLIRLYELGDEPSAWANMLYPILRRFVSAFDGSPDTEFWKHIVHRSGPICEYDVFDGWLAAFCVWTNEGKWKAGPLPPLLDIPRPPPTIVGPGPRPELVRPTQCMRLAKMLCAPFLKARTRRSEAGPSLTPEGQREEDASKSTATADGTASSQSILAVEKYSACYTLDGVPYFTVDIGSIPPGYCEVDVTAVSSRATFPCKMIAGHVASVATAKDPEGPCNTLTPAPQWFIVEKQPEMAPIVHSSIF